MSDLKVYSLINQILKKHNIDIELILYRDLKIDFVNKSIGWHTVSIPDRTPNNLISNFLRDNHFKTESQSNQTYYHYLKSIDYLKEILEIDTIRLYNLNKQLKNDNTEYRHFLDSNGIVFPKFEEQISDIKDDTFIWCLTKDRNSQRHWEEYADNWNGVAISIEFSNVNYKKNIIDLVPISYDLAFLIDIQTELKKQFDLKLEIDNFHFFAKNFKSKDYDWENEIRLCLDYNINYIHKFITNQYRIEESNKDELTKIFTTTLDKKINQNYILVPLRNSFFQITIKEIFASPEQYEKIKPLITNRNIAFIEKKK